jgi:hypothetical protein
MIIKLREESITTTQERDKLQQETVCLEFHLYFYINCHLENVKSYIYILLKDSVFKHRFSRL